MGWNVKIVLENKIKLSIWSQNAKCRNYEIGKVSKTDIV